MTTGTYLDRIIPQTVEDLKARKSLRSLVELRSRVADAPDPMDFVGAFAGDRLHLIAEVKRASPSKGVLAADIDVPALARLYVDNGATAISVLTDGPFFRGSLDNLSIVREATRSDRTPILRKDFIVDPYQVVEARLYGADAILLIAACLSDAELVDLQGEASSLGLGALIEVHDEAELFRVIDVKPRMVGINNRDLRTFETDLGTTHGLAPRVPFRVKVVSESGISTREDARLMRAAGADAILVGESLIRASDIAHQVRQLSSVGDPSLSTIAMQQGEFADPR